MLSPICDRGLQTGNGAPNFGIAGTGARRPAGALLPGHPSPAAESPALHRTAQQAPDPIGLMISNRMPLLTVRYTRWVRN